MNRFIFKIVFSLVMSLVIIMGYTLGEVVTAQSPVIKITNSSSNIFLRGGLVNENFIKDIKDRW